MARIAKCPKCGSKAILFDTGDNAWIVICSQTKCLESWEPDVGTKERAIECWNNHVDRIKRGKRE